MNLKNKDNFVKWMVGFVLFLFLLFAYLFKIDEDVKHYDQYHDWIVQLKLIDKELDSFMVQKLTFTNYDNINFKIDTFETTLMALQNSDMGSILDLQLESDLAAVRNSYAEKIDLIEYSKSNNAQILNSMHYLFQLAEGIGNDPTVPAEVKKLMRDILFRLLQEFLNIHLSSEVLESKLEKLNQFRPDEQIKRVSYFSKHAQSMMENIQQLHYIHVESGEVLLYEKLSVLHNKLDAGYQYKMFQQRLIALFAFVSAFIFVVALIRVYSRSVRVKQRLLAFRSAVEHSDNSVVMTDADRNIIYVNDVFERDSGYKASEVLGKNPRILKSDLIDQSYYDELNDALNRGEKWEGEFINMKKDGSLFHEKASIVPVYIQNKLVNYLAIKLDITKYVEQQKEMDFLAYHDALTRLPNRIFFEERLEQVLAISRRKGTRAAILFIDLDRFKVINDTLGHHVGDEMLKRHTRPSWRG
jgi:PAS domain S-box-containing protein